MKRTAFFALFWILVLLAGCSSNSAGSAGDMQPPAEAAPGLSTEAAAGEETAADSHSVSMPSDPGRKLIRTVWLTAETENFSGLMEQVSSHTTQLGGYVESQEADYGNASDRFQARRADLTIRIPAEQLQTFVGRISELSHILRSRETAEDITLTYADTESRMAALETERDRLMALMEQAETMEDLLAVESRLTEVRYQLESTGSQLKLYDNLVSYSTVYLAVEEVQKLTPTEQPTIWEKSPTASGKTFPPWGSGLASPFGVPRGGDSLLGSLGPSGVAAVPPGPAPAKEGQSRFAASRPSPRRISKLSLPPARVHSSPAYHGM